MRGDLYYNRNPIEKLNIVFELKASVNYNICMLQPVSPNISFPEIEEKILKFWKENKIFEKSVDKDYGGKKWTFLDGPPFVTGMPHYGSLLSSLPKDVFGRYWTMKGYKVRRVWGWDGHGLPIENKVEAALGVERKKDIEDKIGVDKFITECRKYVNNVSSEWEWYVDHIGRWVDFKNAYKTWDTDYMESVMWVFKSLYERGHIYKGLRIGLYCPHCSTPVSNFEVAMDADNYKELSDFATTYKYKLKDEDNTYILAWSTTPWNKIVTSALAVNPKLKYVKVKQNGENYILAKSTLQTLGEKKSYEIIEEFDGQELVGKKFEPHYDYYKEKVKAGNRVFEIAGADFVTAEEGTGVVTIAVYGEEDLKLMNEQNIHKEIHLDEEGNVKEEVPQFSGMYYLKANKAVNEDLKNRNLIYKDEQKVHSVPLCWRCHTRLYYAPLDAWFVDIQSLKDKLKKVNEDINWFPKHFKTGRFLKSLESAPDWNISRNRYWGSPVPVWECKCGNRIVTGSIAEIEELSGVRVKDLHKPEIDQVQILCKKCGQMTKRVPEVLDSWIEAGSASLAERHYPFDSARGKPFPREKLENFFPPDFIAEYTGQIRAWFYVLHVIGVGLFDSKAFKNVLVEGVILGTDGRKMSKNYGNYPDPKEMLGKYGGDALRLYLLGSNVMKGEDIKISEDDYREQVKGSMLILWNIYNFFVSNAVLLDWKMQDLSSKPTGTLDRWLISKTERLTLSVTKSLDAYDTVGAINEIKAFINDFSTWYIRRSRERLYNEEKAEIEAFFVVTRFVLIRLSKLISPIMPFVSEEIYKNLTDEESVHLAQWPESNKELIDMELEKGMDLLREIVEMVHFERKKAQIKVRQPLVSVKLISNIPLSEDLKKILCQEVNVKEIIQEKGEEIKVELDTNVTGALREEGEAREIIRSIQQERKRLGTNRSELVNVKISSWPEEFEEEIKRRTQVNELIKADKFEVERINE